MWEHMKIHDNVHSKDIFRENQYDDSRLRSNFLASGLTYDKTQNIVPPVRTTSSVPKSTSTPTSLHQIFAVGNPGDTTSS